MDFHDLTKPVLTEPGVKYFLNQTLKQCHVVRNNFHNTVFNIGMFIGFLIILGLILLSKIKQLQEAKKIAQQELITGLPRWENEYDSINNKTNY